MLMVCDTMASIELGVRNDPNVRLVTYREILERAPKRTREADNPFAVPIQFMGYSTSIVPDGMFGLEYTNGFRFFVIEAENKNRVDSVNLKQNSFKKKFLQYKATGASKAFQKHYGMPDNMTILQLVVVPSERRIKTMSDLITKLAGGSTKFLFKSTRILGASAPEPNDDMYTTPWYRVNHEPFYLNAI
jgi:hypothetical protein